VVRVRTLMTELVRVAAAYFSGFPGESATAAAITWVSNDVGDSSRGMRCRGACSRATHPIRAPEIMGRRKLVFGILNMFTLLFIH
jgi:hypothetical protein